MKAASSQYDWHLQVFSGGDLIDSDLIQYAKVAEAQRILEMQGYEVRAEPSWASNEGDKTEANYISENIPGDEDSNQIIEGDPQELPMVSSKLSNTEATKVQEAIGILEKALRYGPIMSSPTAVKQFCKLKVASEIDEHFCCLFLTTQHQLICFESLFRGSIAGSAVYPRVVARRCLELNAAAVIFTHNHPSGICKPSQADIRITQRLKEALNLFDIAVLDHIIAGLKETYSMAEEGLL